MKRNLSTALGVIAILSLSTGCSYLSAKFGPDKTAYKGSKQTGPLQVPPGMDMPNHSGALTIPEPGKPVAAAADSSVPAAGISSVQAPAIGPPPVSPPSVNAQPDQLGQSLQIDDSVASTWKRVGLALERSGIATIQSRDENAHTYEVSAYGETIEEVGWFQNVVTFGMADDDVVLVPVSLRVSVRPSAEAGSSTIVVEGGSAEASASAASKVLTTLRDRMS